MDFFTILQIIIALTFIYFIVSLVVSELQEQLAAVNQWRARNLEQAIEIFLGDKLCQKLYSSDTIFSSFNQFAAEKSGVGPSYIDSQIFAESLLALINKDLVALGNELAFNQKLFPESTNMNTSPTSPLSENLTHQQEGEADIQTNNNPIDASTSSNDVNGTNASIVNKLELLKNIKNDKNERVYEDKFIARLIDIAYVTKLKRNDPMIQDFANEISITFSQVMERTSGVYKRHAKGVSLVFGLVTAFLFNIDTLYIVNQLYKDPSLRQSFDQLATDMVGANSKCLEAANDNEEAIKACQADLEARTESLKTSFSENQSLPIGWTQDDTVLDQIRVQGGPQVILGWFISAIAISMGAPFWFDLLSKVVNVRNTVRPLSPGENVKPKSNETGDS